VPTLLWVNQFALLPSDGGGTRHFELGRELVRRGWRVTVIASDFHLHRRAYSRRSGPDDREPVREMVEGVEMVWLWAAPYQANDWRRAWNWLSFARSVRRYCATLAKPDVVIGSSPQLFAARAAHHVALSFAVPFVFEVRDLWPESLLAAGGRAGPAYYVLHRVAAKLYRAAERILVLARGTADYLVERGIPQRKLIHVPNGVDVESVRPASPSPSGRKQFTVVYAGAHGAANGLDRILDAAALLGQSSGGSTVRFLFVGDGPAKSQLQSDAVRRGLNSVEFRDTVSRPELVAIFAGVDAGLMILRDAPLFSFAVSPNKLFDYLAAALPVICNVPGEVARMVNESGAGVQARDSSGEALAEAIVTLQSLPPEERHAMGASGRQWVEREHSREVLGARLDRFLRELIVG